MDNIMEHIAESGMGQKLMQKTLEHEMESQGPAGLMGMAGQFLGGEGGGNHTSHQSYNDEEGHHERREEHRSSGGDGDDDNDDEHRESHRVEERVSREDEDGGREERYSHAQVEESHSESHGGLAGMASKMFHHHEEEKKPADPTGEMISEGLDFARERFLHQTGVEDQDDKIGEALAGYAHKYMENR
ncbi:hypothetical protein AAP_06122 [Ascosphaera apis ARSEF 7405]|uniref:Uncharacterized protein n=1 Tax=Ascosphaera apis ARSEF 7405 TaxID=392613 RepID=A0A167V0D6_9EURO|nr:hypothetical protein AAP_06122 [Ascosphaera apis ARSEF 7405]